MKNSFRGYYRPTDDEFRDLWRDAIITVDANVLLNLYSYSKSTADEFVDLLKSLRDRIWLPHQVALEYHKNRCKAILEEVKPYTDTSAQLQKSLSAITQKKKHPYLPPELEQQFVDVVAQIEDKLTDGENTQRALVSNDGILDEITALFEQRVGEATKDSTLDEIYKEGKKRYARRVPPGYCDEGKPEPGRYGDLVIWKQLIEHAKEQKKPMVFVTDDAKGDWWSIIGSSTTGPRNELLQEFHRETGSNIYIYSLESFIAENDKLGSKLSKAALEEIQRLFSDKTSFDDDGFLDYAILDSLVKIASNLDNWNAMLANNGGRDTILKLGLSRIGLSDDELERLFETLKKGTIERKILNAIILLYGQEPEFDLPGCVRKLSSGMTDLEMNEMLVSMLQSLATSSNDVSAQF